MCTICFNFRKLYRYIFFLHFFSTVGPKDGNVTQPETKALVKWMKDTPTVMSASLHGGSLVVTFPYTNSLSDIPEATLTQDNDIFKTSALTYSTLHPTMSHGQPFCPGAHVQDR